MKIRILCMREDVAPNLPVRRGLKPNGFAPPSSWKREMQD
jgi:hypothetical protein